MEKYEILVLDMQLQTLTDFRDQNNQWVMS